jgi:hypothetical protein
MDTVLNTYYLTVKLIILHLARVEQEIEARMMYILTLRVNSYM